MLVSTLRSHRHVNQISATNLIIKSIKLVLVINSLLDDIFKGYLLVVDKLVPGAGPEASAQAVLGLCVGRCPAKL